MTLYGKTLRVSTGWVDGPDTALPGLYFKPGIGLYWVDDEGAEHQILPYPIPTSDPAVAGELWANSGVVTVSSG
jgi:hypothetical protein